MSEMYTHYRVAPGSEGQEHICEAHGCGARVRDSDRRAHDLTHPERAEASRSGGEAWQPVCGCEAGMGRMDRGCHSYGLCHAQSAERRGLVASQADGDLRERLHQIVEIHARGAREIRRALDGP